MRKALMVGLLLPLAGCAETVEDASWSASPAVKPATSLPTVAAPSPHRESSIPVPPPKPKLVLYLTVEPADAGFEAAVREALRARLDNLDLRQGGAPADGLHLSLRHFRWNEDERTEATRTVTYRRDQVNGHVLPAGAVYQVDYLTGRATVGLSFRLTLERGGRRLAETEVGDRVVEPWSTCRLARIVDAAGAAKAAPFVANRDMQALCAGKAVVAPDAAVNKVADAALALPWTGKAGGSF